MKKIRELGQRSKDKFIGGSEEMEIEKPRGYKNLEIFADTETFLDTGGMDPWDYVGTKDYSTALAEAVVVPFILVWQYRRKKNCPSKEQLFDAGWVKKYRLHDDDEFEDFLLDLSFIYNEWDLTPVLYFHNSSYDLGALMPFLKKHDPELTIYWYANRQNKRFRKGCMQSEKYNFYCEFGDTMKYNKESIAKAGEVLGKPKIEGMPYGMCDITIENNVITYRSLDSGLTAEYPLDKYIEYAIRDVDIMRDTHTRRNKIIEQVNKIMIEDYEDKKNLQNNIMGACSTLGSHSKTILNYYLKSLGWEGSRSAGTSPVDTWFRFHLPDTDVYRAAVEANCGGFTSFNKDLSKFECDEDWTIKCFDMNSMYPTMMKRGISYGEILDVPPEGPYIKWYVIKLKSCQWKGVMAASINQAFGDKKMAMYPFYVWSEYFDWVLERADVEYELVATKYQQTTRILGDLVDKYYRERNLRKKAMEKHLYQSKDWQDLNDQQNMLKVLMNSMYGKMCEKGHHLDCVYHNDAYNTYPATKIYNPCILSGAHITYQGRLTLLKKIEAVMKRGWIYLYSDTDSVIFAYPKNDDPTVIFGKDTGELGEWKEEGTFDLYLNIMKKKKYCIINTRLKDLTPGQKLPYKLAFSGVNKSFIEKRLKNDFKGAIEDLKFMFNPENNVKLVCMNTTSILNNYYDQIVIYNTDFEVNGGMDKNGKRVPVNAEVVETPEGFMLTRF